jgi:uncharacterized protein (DUF2141 family)
MEPEPELVEHFFAAKSGHRVHDRKLFRLRETGITAWSVLVMSNFRLSVFAPTLLALVPLSAADAVVLGPDAPICGANNSSAVLVKVNGLKSRAGAVRARTFLGANPKHWFDKKMALKRTEVRVPAAGQVEICMPVPKPGGYVIDIRHDANSDGKTDRSDGAGASGNPEMSLFSFLMGKKPPASKVVVQVGTGVTTINVLVKYVQGGSFQPVQVTAR